MTDKEIIQALRCCAKGLGHDDACENCKVGEIQDRREYIEFAAANVIERLTADVAEVVRCKDCIYNIDGMCFSRTSFKNAVAVEPNNFCSWGATE